MIVLVTQAQIPTPSHPLGAHFLTIPAFKPHDKIFLGASTEVPGHSIIFFFCGGGGGGEEGGELVNV